MKNKGYFCNVKRIGTLISALIITVLLLIPKEIHAALEANQEVLQEDSVAISLLTCAPGNEVYSLYGHTAIRITNLTQGTDIAVNYGMFSFHKPFFILRFIFGLTDYEMGIVPYEIFREEYLREGRNVYQQTLNLTDNEKKAIIKAIERNYEPQNREYRYNYFYDNCTTRARDILISNINGHVVYSADSTAEYPSYRELIHQNNIESRWARLGNDLLLGVKADKKTDLTEQQFLPLNLEKNFEHAKIINTDSTTRPLLTNSNVVVDTTPIKTVPSFPLTPLECAWILCSLTALITIYEWWKKGNFWLFDTLLLIVTGCGGVLLFLMLFSQHPTTSTNLQILLLNPLTLVMGWRTVKRMRKNKKDSFWKWAFIFIILFMIGGIWQNYAEGMYVVALSLLIRTARRQFKIYFEKNDK